MELNKFAIDDILKLNVESKEIRNWAKLCNLFAQNAATFQDEDEPILKDFIRNYPPGKYRWDHLNMISILCFGLLYFNKEKFLDENINLDELKEAVLKEKVFCDEVLYSYFEDKFTDYGDIDPVAVTIENIFKNIDDPKNDAWLRIKKSHKILKMKDYLDKNLEKRNLKERSPKI